jgi:Na+/melibiose symporter-like transporter
MRSSGKSSVVFMLAIIPAIWFYGDSGQASRATAGAARVDSVREALSEFPAVAVGVFSCTEVLQFSRVPQDGAEILPLVAANVVWSVLAGATPVLLFAMYADVADYYEWKFARRAIKLLFSVIPAGLSLVYGLILTLYPINEAMLRRIEGELKARRSGSTRA